MYISKDFTVNLFGNSYESNDETALGEPTLWLYIADGSCIEVTHEEYGLDKADMFFSIRHHVSDYDFDMGICESTCGVIAKMNASTIKETEDLVEFYLQARKLSLSFSA